MQIQCECGSWKKKSKPGSSSPQQRYGAASKILAALSSSPPAVLQSLRASKETKTGQVPAVSRAWIQQIQALSAYRLSCLKSIDSVSQKEAKGLIWIHHESRRITSLHPLSQPTAIFRKQCQCTKQCRDVCTVSRRQKSVFHEGVCIYSSEGTVLSQKMCVCVRTCLWGEKWQMVAGVCCPWSSCRCEDVQQQDKAQKHECVCVRQREKQTQTVCPQQHQSIPLNLLCAK